METDTTEKITEKLSNACIGRVLRAEILEPYTTFRVGGQADLFVEPADRESLLAALRILRAEKIPVFILGGGSNLVFSDSGIRGAVVSTRSNRAVGQLSETLIRCAAGCSFGDISRFCAEHSLSGLEEFCGLPGTVGGAVFMNARCYEKSVSDMLVSCAYAAVPEYAVAEYVFSRDDWDYKKSPFQGTERLILDAVLRVCPGNAAEIAEKNAFFLEDRKKRRQFDFPSAGSVFKNNRLFGAPSGKLIDETGLCGTRMGGAQVAPWHGNFIINTGGASAADIKKLTETVIEKVREKTGFTLEPEILFAGF